MSDHSISIRKHLDSGIANAAQLMDFAGISQATLSRTLSVMGEGVLRIGAGKSIHYALRNRLHGLADMPVYRIDRDGALHEQGMLIPVRPQGFVMQDKNGKSTHSDGLPWWLYDMRPQGYLGSAWARKHAEALGLSTQLHLWQDHHVLRA